MARELEFVTGYARDDDVAERHTLLEGPAFLLVNLVLAFPDAFASGELLNARDVDTVHARAVVGEQGRQWPPDHLGPIDDADGPAEKPVTVGQDGVVDV